MFDFKKMLKFWKNVPLPLCRTFKPTGASAGKAKKQRNKNNKNKKNKNKKKKNRRRNINTTIIFLWRD